MYVNTTGNIRADGKDVAIILTRWELEKLKNILSEYVQTHSIAQDYVAASIVREIEDFESNE